jgi:hypothetical protein
MDLTPDMLADLNLANLQQRRAEAVETQKKAAARVQRAMADHFLRYWLGGGAMALIAIALGQAVPDDSPVGMFAVSAATIFWLGLWIAAFFSTGAVRKLQDAANAAACQVTQIDKKIFFCHRVLDEADRAKVRTVAQALVDRRAK